MKDSKTRGLISVIVLVIVWQVLCEVTGVNQALVPSPIKVVEAFYELITKGLIGSISRVTLVGHIGISLYRFAIGYITAVILAVILGLLFGYHPGAFDVINPVVQIIRPIAPVAFMPFIVLWFGIGNLPAIVIIFIAAFFPVFLSTVAATQNVNPIYLKVAQNYGLGKMKTIFGICFPAIFSQIANSLRLALGTAWIFLVSGEMVGAQSGLGFLIMDTKNCIRFDSLMATMITIGAIGFLLDYLMRVLEKRVNLLFGIRQEEK
ncbi:MAG: ABC transporter permease [Lachnospiraceae bacterium]|nr:ABC transporter permease [Lachnospiraceae bacterium]